MLNLLNYVSPQSIKTEGIKYAGSKAKLIAPIITMIYSLKPNRVFDGFSGTTRVSQALAKTGYQVISNDKAIWSKTFAEAYLNANKSDHHYQKILSDLNSLKPKHGWFSEYYGGEVSRKNNISIGKDGLKKPFQMHNANKLDAIREEIDRLSLTLDEKNVALTSLIMALERVDNTLGHYAAYLKNWSLRSYNKLQLILPGIVRSDRVHSVHNKDTIELTKSVCADVAYFDPPYGSNNEKMPPSRVRYEAYYHIWKTVILHDQPILFGAANRRRDCSDTVSGSDFEEFRRRSGGGFIAVEAIERLIENTASPNIILSYSSGGRATANDLTRILNRSGKVVDFVKISYKKNVMAHMKWTNDWIRGNESENMEYLFLLKKEL